ncbi:MAG: dUTP diphosphatase [Clostridia bacterium]
MILKFKKIPSKNGQVAKNPAFATEGSACFDLTCNLDEQITIKPNETVKIPTGIAIELENNSLVALVFPRSGLSSNFGISLANCVGVIDADYRGEILVPLVNNSSENFTLNPFDRIAQLGITEIFKPSLVECKELSDTSRGVSGFGSTGI